MTEMTEALTPEIEPHAHACGCGCHDHDEEGWGHDACDCGEADCDCGCGDEEGDDFDLRYVSDTQIACSAEDLTDLLNFDADVGEELYARLGLTAVTQQADDFEYVEFKEICAGGYYMVTFPPETDFSDFTVAQALSIEEISAERFEELALDDSEMACDGNCECCDQDCIGKQPVL
jgi:hypothetical protein